MGITFISRKASFRDDGLWQWSGIVRDGWWQARWMSGDHGGRLASSESSPESEASENGTSGSAGEACDTEPSRNGDRVLGQRSESIDRIRFGVLRSR